MADLNFDAGYDSASDSGPRANPTASNFEKSEPVKTANDSKAAKPKHHKRALNREGRAICRIVHAHGWSAPKIAAIFNLTQKPIERAIENSYVPPDNKLKDYNHVGQDFRKKFPPKSGVEHLIHPNGSESVDKNEVVSLVSTTPTHENVRRYYDQHFALPPRPYVYVGRSFEKRNYNQVTEVEDSIQTPKKPRHGQGIGSEAAPLPSLILDCRSIDLRPKFPMVSHASENSHSVPRLNKSSTSASMPVPRLNKTPEVANTIQSCAMGPRSAPRATTTPASLPPAEIFVAFLTGLDLSKHLALFTERGFHDIAILRTMARLDEKTLHTTLRRWLAEDLEHPGVTDGLTDAELLTFETAIRQL